MLVDDGSSVHGAGIRVEELGPLDQYGVQAERFAEAVRTGRPAPTTLEDELANMAVIDALVESGATGRWVAPAGSESHR